MLVVCPCDRVRFLSRDASRAAISPSIERGKKICDLLTVSRDDRYVDDVSYDKCYPG